jgi:hypothetical protein
VPEAAKGSVFCSLVLSASMSRYTSYRAPHRKSNLGLDCLGGVRQHSPHQARAGAGGYDWAALAFAVGFGGSMIWFVLQPAWRYQPVPGGQTVGQWLREVVAVAYVVSSSSSCSWSAAPAGSHRSF